MNVTFNLTRFCFPLSLSIFFSQRNPSLISTGVFNAPILFKYEHNFFIVSIFLNGSPSITTEFSASDKHYSFCDCALASWIFCRAAPENTENISSRPSRMILIVLNGIAADVKSSRNLATGINIPFGKKNQKY